MTDWASDGELMWASLAEDQSETNLLRACDWALEHDRPVLAYVFAACAYFKVSTVYGHYLFDPDKPSHVFRWSPYWYEDEEHYDVRKTLDEARFLTKGFDSVREAFEALATYSEWSLYHNGIIQYLVLKIRRRACRA